MTTSPFHPSRCSSIAGALAALDTMLGLGVFSKDELWEEAQRHRGLRGVGQLRAIVPLADPRSESPAEAITRLRWLHADIMPRPEPQIEVERPFHWPYRIDLGVEELLFGLEYDGEEWHGVRPSSVLATNGDAPRWTRSGDG